MNHINSNTNPCSSCGLCAVSCSQNAITIEHDENGFYRPTVNERICTDCGICSKVCYKFLDEKTAFENTFQNKSVYAAWSKDRNTVLTSSSGGISHELISYYGNAGYKICGVIFDAPNDVCKHIIAESREDIEAIKTSKYLQSYTVEAFSQFNKNEKHVVAGTPCQIYGLHQWIKFKKWEDNFILVDFFCHGTPSFNLWRKNKEYICKEFQLDSRWKSVSFRKKTSELKWRSYATSIEDSFGKKFEKNKAFPGNLFPKFFLNNSCLNEACDRCKLRLDNCASDIRLGDFWGPKYSSNEEGVSLVIINTSKGEKVLEEIADRLVIEKCTFEDLELSQPVRYLSMHPKQMIILEELKGNKPLNIIYDKYFKQSFLKKGLLSIKRKLLK